MCTVVFLRRPDHDWPLILAANRDEMAARPWKPPARHWPDRPATLAGLDGLAGGTWLGINDHGLVAGALNRKDSLGPASRLRSRGELPLKALEHPNATAAVDALATLDPAEYRGFNLFVADNRDAYWLHSLGPGRSRCVEVLPIPEGVSMLTAWGLNAPESARTRRFHPVFEAARTPDPGSGHWGEWPRLMRRRDFDPDGGPAEAMYVVTNYGFGTLCTSLIAAARTPPHDDSARLFWHFASAPSGRNGRWEIIAGRPTSTAVPAAETEQESRSGHDRCRRSASR